MSELVECDQCSDLLPSLFMNVIETVAPETSFQPGIIELEVVCDICFAKKQGSAADIARAEREQWTRSRDPHYESFLKYTFEK